MDKKNILVCVMIIIALMALGVAFASNNMVKKNNINNTGNMTLNKTSNNTTVEHINNDNQQDVSSRSYADMAHDADVHTNKEKAKELNDNIVGHDENGGAYFSDGSYVPPKI